MSLQEITKESFQEFLNQVPNASFMQSLAMAKLLEKRGAQVRFLGFYQEDQLKVAALAFCNAIAGGLRMEINCGPIHINENALPDFYQELTTYAKTEGVLELIVKPYDTYQTFDSDGEVRTPERGRLLSMLTDVGFRHDGLHTGYPGGEPDWHYVKDLTDLSAPTLLGSFSKRGKALLKKANRFGIVLRKLKREELAAFKDITEATSDRREYDDKSLDYYQDFYDAFGEEAEFMVATLHFGDYLANLEADQAVLADKMAGLEAALLENPGATKKANQLRELTSQFETFEVRKAEAREWIAQYGDQEVILAGSLFLYTDKEATYLFSGSYPAFNKFYAPALLQEYVMQEAIRRGLTFYNFLGIMGIFDGSDGVLRFKQNFNGYIVRKMGTFRYYPNPIKHQVLHFIKKVTGRL